MGAPGFFGRRDGKRKQIICAQSIWPASRLVCGNLKLLLVERKQGSPSIINVDDKKSTLHAAEADFFVYHAVVQNTALVHIEAPVKGFEHRAIKPRCLIESSHVVRQRFTSGTKKNLKLNEVSELNEVETK